MVVFCGIFYDSKFGCCFRTGGAEEIAAREVFRQILSATFFVSCCLVDTYVHRWKRGGRGMGESVVLLWWGSAPACVRVCVSGVCGDVEGRCRTHVKSLSGVKFFAGFVSQIQQ